MLIFETLPYDSYIRYKICWILDSSIVACLILILAHIYELRISWLLSAFVVEKHKPESVYEIMGVSNVSAHLSLSTTGPLHISNIQ